MARTLIGNLIERWKWEARSNALIAKHNASVYTTSFNSPGYREGVQDNPLLPNVWTGDDATSEDAILSNDIATMRSHALDLYRNSSLARSIVDGVGRYLGYSMPSATTTDTEWNKLADEYFENWARKADARQRPGVDFGTFQELWSNCAYIMGDMAFGLYDGKLYPYEGVQIDTPQKLNKDPNVRNGVRVSGTFPNPITHYYICGMGKYGALDRSTFTRLAANQLIYAPAKYWRPAMLRAAPDMHGNIDAMRQFNDTVDNVAAKINIESRLISKETRGALGNMPGSRIVSAASDSNGNTEKLKVSRMDRLMRLQINGDPSAFELQKMENPGAYFEPYMLLAARIFSAGFGLPLEIVLHLFTNGSYTANRMARTDFKRTIMDRWDHRRKVLCQPTRNWVIARAIKYGELPPAPADPITGFSQFWKCNWSTPRFEMIDEGKEADGDAKLYGIGRASLEQFAREQQTTVEAMIQKRKEEITGLTAAAKDVGVTLDVFMAGLFKQQQQPTGAPTE